MCYAGIAGDADAQKFRYAIEAFESSGPFVEKNVGGDDITRVWRCCFLVVACMRMSLKALDWMSKRSPEQIMHEREAMISALEEAGKRMWETGLVAQWFATADPQTRAVASKVNGYLLEVLLTATSYVQPTCGDLFRYGVFFVPSCACIACCWSSSGRCRIIG